MRNEGCSPCSVPSPTLLIERFGNGCLHHGCIEFESIGKSPEQTFGMFEASSTDLFEPTTTLGKVAIAIPLARLHLCPKEAGWRRSDIRLLDAQASCMRRDGKNPRAVVTEPASNIHSREQP